MLLLSTLPLYPTPVPLLAFSFSPSVAEDTCDLVLQGALINPAKFREKTNEKKRNMGIIMHRLLVYFCSSIYYCSNSLVLVKVVLENKMEDVPSWRAAETVKKCIQACTRNWHKLIIQHGPRKAVQTPHNIANWARRTGKTATGTPIQCQLVHLDIEHRLSTTYFSRAAEEQV